MTNNNNFDLFFYRHNKNQQHVHDIQQHQLLFCELTLCFEGELNYFVDNKPITLHPGDIIFIKNGQLRSRTGSSLFADYVSFNFKCNNVPNLKGYFEKGIDQEIRLSVMCCDEGFAERGLNENIEMIAQTIINKLLYKQNCPSYSPLTQKILKLLQNNVCKKISLEEISKQMYFSATYCQNIFKHDTGKSILQYFNNLKVEEAKALMIQGELSLAKIAEKLGFEDYNYFSRLFKKNCNYSPKEYLTNLVKE